MGLILQLILHSHASTCVKIISPNRRNDVEPQVWCFLPGKSNCLHHVRPDKTTRVATVTESVYLLRCSCRVKRRLDEGAGV
jgi:hypothetical protein